MRYLKIAAITLFLALNGYAHYLHYKKLEVVRDVLVQLYTNDIAIVGAFNDLKASISNDL